MHAIPETTSSNLCRVCMPESLHESFLNARDNNASAYTAVSMIRECIEACKHLVDLYDSGLTGFPLARSVVDNINERVTDAVSLASETLGLSFTSYLGTCLIRFDQYDNTIDYSRLLPCAEAIETIADNLSVIEALAE